jgi:hypothetical protein
MSDTTADKTPADKKAKPIFNPDDVVEPAVDFGPADPKPADPKPAVSKPVDPTPADVAVEEPAVVEPAAEKPKPAKRPKVSKTDTAVVEPASATATGTATGEVAPVVTDTTPAPGTTPATDSEFAGREVVYVQAPIPPRLKGNRGVGALLAVLGALVFAAIFAALGFVLVAVGLAAPGATFAQFVLSPEFLIPVPIFLVAFVLLVLIVNRGGWAAHVFGSLVVGLAVYFGTAGVASLLYTVSGAGVPPFGDLLSNPYIIVAALIAREVAIWIGLAIAARGRRVKARNLELVDEWEQEHAETKAQYERAGATT